MVQSDAPPSSSHTRLYVQVLIAIAVGVLVGYVWPSIGTLMRPLGDGFIKLIKMMISPIVFCTVVVGIAKMGSMKQVGRIGLTALIYFEVVSTVALLLGLIVANVVQPGSGINADVNALDTQAVAAYAQQAEHLSTVEFILNIIPSTVVGAFAGGELLQVLLFSVLFGIALLQVGPAAQVLVNIIDQFGNGLFAVIGIIMRAAPIGAFGAMAFTIGTYGIGTLLSLGKLLVAVYLTCLLFVFVILGAIAWWAGLSIWKLLKYTREELVIVLGTSSSESALPRIMSKLERLGCAKPVVGLVIPTGYSFNLDGTSIYMTMAALFIAQATNTDLTWTQQVGILAVLLLTSKGAAAVTGSGFVTLAATLSVIPSLPPAGLALLLGVDRFMSEARAITNLIGNTVATVVVAKYEGAFDAARAAKVLDGETIADPDAAAMPKKKEEEHAAMVTATSPTIIPG